MIEAYLKLTRSIRFKLVPADEAYSDLKSFEWKLERYDEDAIGFGITFDNPHYLSANGVDTMLITFYNSAAYMSPVDKALASVPDGFKLVVKIPPQSYENELMKTEEKESVESIA